MFPLRKVMMLVTVALLLVATLALAAFGVDTAPVAAAAPAAVPAVSWFTGVIAWMTGNQVIVGALLVAVLDFIFAINPQWQSNGALHMLYTVASKKSGGTGTGA